MRKKLFLLVCLSVVASLAHAQFVKVDPADYRIEKKDIDRARKIISTPVAKPVFPNPHPGAQWYPDATLGLFMHWGIHSVAGLQPSWAMISGYIYGGISNPKDYYALADKFHPHNYNPDKYLKACKEAGFTYAVLTTRHHDGYALYPSKYGISTKQYDGGRDYLKTYVESCRRNGLRVGFYYSPGDWHYPGFSYDTDFNAKTRGKTKPVITDSVGNYREYEKFLGYVLAQIEELLTRYGKIDVLWLDGMYFHGVKDMHNNQIYAWIRSLQPDIVINDRWSNLVTPDNPGGTDLRVGDFTTPFECSMPTYRPSKWWEECHIWTCGGGGWGYDKTGTFRPLSWLFDLFTQTRSMAGNLLINVGPDGNGDMHPHFYQEIDSLKTWMGHSKESLIGAGPSPGIERSNVRLTSRGKDIWYAHLLPGFNKQVSVWTERKPKKLILMRTGEEVPFTDLDGYITFKIAPEKRTPIDDVVKIIF